MCVVLKASRCFNHFALIGTPAMKVKSIFHEMVTDKPHFAKTNIISSTTTKKHTKKIGVALPSDGLAGARTVTITVSWHTLDVQSEH